MLGQKLSHAFDLCVIVQAGVGPFHLDQERRAKHSRLQRNEIHLSILPTRIMERSIGVEPLRENGGFNKTAHVLIVNFNWRK